MKNNLVDLDADTILIGGEQESPRIIKRSRSPRLIFDSRKGLCINEAYLGYLAGHPIQQNYSPDAERRY